MDAHGRRWILTGRVPLRMSVSRQGPSASFRHGVGTVRYAPRYSAPPVYMCCRVRGRCSAAGRTRARCVPCSACSAPGPARAAERRRGAAAHMLESTILLVVQVAVVTMRSCG